MQAERAAAAPGSAGTAAVARVRAAIAHAAFGRASTASIAIAVLVALAARLPYFTRSDFPLNDGGMFVAMSRDLLDAHFALPAFTSYNFAAIPFAYPPVAFYLVALLSGATGVDAVALARSLPLAANLATVAAVAILAHSLLGKGWAALLAPAIFALIPRSFEWLIMGGGLTRSFGLLFAVASLVQAHRLFTIPSLGRASLCALLAALALATHLEMGLFALDSIALMALLDGRSVRAVLTSVGIMAAAGVLTAPWWATVIARHGLSPFDAASATGGWSSVKEELLALQDFTTPPRLLLSLPSALAVVGALVCVLRGQLFVPVWLPAIFLLVPRSAPSEATVPLALLAGVGLADVVAPGVASAVRNSRTSCLVAAAWDNLRSGVAPVVAVSLLSVGLSFCLTLGAVFVYWPRMEVNPQTLATVSVADRQAMRWVSEHTAGTDQFLVLTPTWSWEEDHVGEWFPVIAGRRSIVTPQGAEWLPDNAHARTVCLWQDVRALGSAGLGVDELDTWARDRGVGFNDVFVSQGVPSPVNWGILVASAEASPNYTVAYQGDGVAVLQRRQPIVPRWGGDVAVASDCQAFADQPDAVQWTFEATYGAAAAHEWVAQHQRSLDGRVPLCRRLAQLGLVKLAC